MNPVHYLLFFILIGMMGAARPCEAQKKAGDWPGWNRYQAVLWSTGGVPENAPSWFKQLRQAGITAQEMDRGGDPSPFLQNDFGFYVENIYRIAFLHGARPAYEADFKGYTETKDKKYLIRKPCLHDPAYLPEARETIQRYIRQHKDSKPLLYDIGDEMSLGSFASPMDYCFSEHTLRAFRGWLQKEYGSLRALNREWETSFTSWDAVEPMTTYEIKERESGGSENYAPWADHRTFMEIAFAEALGKFRDYIHEIDPDVPAGAEGLQMPSAWGGFDLWRLSKVFDWIEPYDIGNSREIFRSFMPDGLVLSTLFEPDGKSAGRRLWRLLLTGDRGTIIWDDESSRCVDKDKEGYPLTRRGQELAPVFEELRRIGPTLFGLKLRDDRIAIHYSQASIHAHWMFDSRADGNSWPRRFSSYESVHSGLAQVRDSFVRILEDLGLQYKFVSYEQIEQGALVKESYKALLLPQSVALSPQEARQIEAFVMAGGTVIADSMTATMDDHCKRLPSGQLDALFGIERAGTSKPAGNLSWKDQDTSLPAAEALRLKGGKAKVEAGGQPCVIENRAGKGRAVYLNISMARYGKLRLVPPKGDPARSLFESVLAASGIKAAVRAFSPATGKLLPGVRVWRYQGEKADYIALMRNPEFRASELGAIGYSDNAAFETAEEVQVVFPRQTAVRNLRTGQTYAKTDRLTLPLDPWSPLIFEVEKGSGRQ
ncbi:MAG: beta-galactosidase [Armatimonadetes bacterium]|nr:beta-galactosidase [Armatimonadota bacterium]